MRRSQRLRKQKSMGSRRKVLSEGQGAFKPKPDKKTTRVAKYEHHNWGHFVYTDDKAIAVLSHDSQHLQSALDELGRTT